MLPQLLCKKPLVVGGLEGSETAVTGTQTPIPKHPNMIKHGSVNISIWCSLIPHGTRSFLTSEEGISTQIIPQNESTWIYRDVYLFIYIYIHTHSIYLLFNTISRLMWIMITIIIIIIAIIIIVYNIVQSLVLYRMLANIACFEVITARKRGYPPVS